MAYFDWGVQQNPFITVTTGLSISALPFLQGRLQEILGYHANPLLERGWVPQNWSSFVMSWSLFPDWFSCLILFPNLSSFVFSLASLLTLRYHFLRFAGLPPLFQQLSVCSFKSLLKTNIFQEIHPPPLSLIISPASFFIISPLSCSLFSCQTFCECVCSDCFLSYIYF